MELNELKEVSFNATTKASFITMVKNVHFVLTLLEFVFLKEWF